MGVSIVCENEHDAAIGRFEQLSVTGLLNAPEGVIEITKVAICPVATLALPGWLDNVKPANCSFSVGEEAMAKFASPL